MFLHYAVIMILRHSIRWRYCVVDKTTVSTTSFNWVDRLTFYNDDKTSRRLRADECRGGDGALRVYCAAIQRTAVPGPRRRKEVIAAEEQNIINTNNATAAVLGAGRGGGGDSE